MSPKREFTHEEAVRGSIRSTEVRREKKKLKEIANTIMAMDAPPELVKNVLDSWSWTGNMSVAEIMTIQQAQKAMKGDTQAFITLRDTAGQKPVERNVTATIEASAIEEVEQLIDEARGD